MMYRAVDNSKTTEKAVWHGEGEWCCNKVNITNASYLERCDVITHLGGHFKEK